MIISRYYRHNIIGQVEDIKNKLDPISVLATLALLRYKEQQTLIGFNGYQISTESPSNYSVGGISLQGVVRCLFRESREDLEFIPIALERAAQWFEPQKEANELYKDLFLAAKEGLDSLRDSYLSKGSNVTANAIEGWKNSIDGYIVKGGELYQGNPILDEILDKVKKLWKKSEIAEVNNLINQMLDRQGNVLIDKEIRCYNEIVRLELLLRQKGENLRKIYEK